MQLTESTFLMYAMQHYDNPHCYELEEFEEDLRRFQYLRKLFARYKQTGDLRERLILNHLTILYNCFGIKATDMLFFKLEDFHDCLKPFTEYLNCMKETVSYGNKIYLTSDIESDATIKNKLKEL